MVGKKAQECGESVSHCFLSCFVRVDTLTTAIRASQCGHSFERDMGLIPSPQLLTCRKWERA